MAWDLGLGTWDLGLGAWDLGLGAAATSQYYHFLKNRRTFLQKCRIMRASRGLLLCFQFLAKSDII